MKVVLLPMWRTVNNLAPKRPLWPLLSITAVVSGAVAVVVARNFFETQRKIRRTVETDYGVDEPQFIRTMSQLMGPAVVGGNQVTALQNGAEIFPAMLEAIRGASRTITFENFLFRKGKVAEEFADALAERANAGVKVHFLQDALGCNCLHDPMMLRLRREGVELEIFRFRDLLKMNYRTHRKLLVIDGAIGFIGGVGICDDWLGNGNRSGCWRDTHYRVEGPVVAQVQQAFADNWMQTHAEVLHGDAYFPELKKAGDSCCQVFRSSSSEGADSARLMFLLSLAAARRSIRIANAYFIPDDLCVRTLVAALKRGVTVEVITAGPDIDEHAVRLVGRSRWRPMLEAGARFFEFQPARFHCKYLVVDDCWVSVGSANFDNRSLRLNDEANLNVLDRGFASEHLRMFEHDRSQSREMTLEQWRRRPAGERLVALGAGWLRSQM